MSLRISVSDLKHVTTLALFHRMRKDPLQSSGFNDDGLPNKGNYDKAITGEIQYT